jgi:tetratricopeptide (TPR) repeat protein
MPPVNWRGAIWRRRWRRKRVLSIDPRCGEAHYLLGNALLFLGRTNDARSCYQRAIEMSPGLAEAHNDLAIADPWKVHHFRTDMAHQEWMRREEKAFLENPDSVFDAGRRTALKTIQDEIGLDCFGIDCALDPGGDLLVFEVNATMLVHGESGIFAYKRPYIARIKDAFDAMLAKAAGG